MSTPIGDHFTISTTLPTNTITAAQLAIIKGAGFPVFPTNADDFNHTTVPYKNVQQSLERIREEFAITAIVDHLGMPDWFREIVADVPDGVGNGKVLLLRESHNSRLFYVTIDVLV